MHNPLTTLLTRLHLKSSPSNSRPSSSSSNTRRKDRKAAKLAHRDQERTTQGLLRIALKRHGSVNSFTAKDPSVYYRRREDHEGWVRHEAGGGRLNRDWRDGKESLERGGEVVDMSGRGGRSEGEGGRKEWD